MNQMTSAAIPSSASIAATAPTMLSFRNADVVAGAGLIMGLQGESQVRPTDTRSAASRASAASDPSEARDGESAETPC